MIADRARDGDGPVVESPEDSFWPLRASRWVSTRYRPYLGWLVWGACLALAMLPAMVLRANAWIELGRLQSRLDAVAPLAVAVTWLVLGWRRPRLDATPVRWLRAIAGLCAILGIGALVLSQMVAGWLPGPGDLVRAGLDSAWPALLQRTAAQLTELGARYALWWAGAQAGGAVQDNLVFATLAGAILWLMGMLTAWLARRRRQGLVASLPALWLTATLLLYSNIGRQWLIVGLATALILHIALDMEAATRRWRALGLDYSPDLFVDRTLMVLGAGLLILTLAAVIPNLYYRPLVTRYFELIGPANDRAEKLVERYFPDLEASSRRRGRGDLTGLPNEFLLSAGPDLGEAEVLRYRTNEAPVEFNPAYPEESPPPGHYMRGYTLTEYDGKGWQNPRSVVRAGYAANQRWRDLPARGRKEVVQSVFLEFNSQILYSAPEPIEASVDTRLDQRAPDDLVALWGSERSYTLISAVPAVSEEQLAAAPAFGPDTPLPAGYEKHLQLPDTITDRTRQLAERLTAGLENPFAKAQAIEEYLRGYEYDLAVSEPPADVTDVADYFLFDLRRGYCDYYATAFVVLARLAGLPARFATGFAVGAWDPIEQLWIVTEAESHSWPEVYFPDYGWIPFEPTAGRPTLARIGLPDVTAGGIAGAPAPVEPVVPPGIQWNWQMLLWLAPLALTAWGAFALVTRWQAGREDPWEGLQRWGRRHGRPMVSGETVLEYGDGLAGYVLERQPPGQEVGRLVARDIVQLSDDLSQAQYAPNARREPALARVRERWRVLRSYLRRLRLR